MSLSAVKQNERSSRYGCFALLLCSLLLLCWAYFGRFVVVEEYLQAFSKSGLEAVPPLSLYHSLLTSNLWLLPPLLAVAPLVWLAVRRPRSRVALHEGFVFLLAGVLLYLLLNAMMFCALHRYRNHLLGTASGKEEAVPTEAFIDRMIGAAEHV